ncbi:MAG: glycosyl transferase family 2, partial [Bacteroidota bacterium]|nr:glycosyl transferase family 2 [Bacteroidota bacterium]MDX5428133.1 glycosyl transferase family 2 [Bacteroidota bacterium]
LLQILVLLSGMIELTLEKMGFHFRALRFVSHFIWMNVALFWGLIKFFIGVKSNVWQPTQRNQE